MIFNTNNNGFLMVEQYTTAETDGIVQIITGSNGAAEHIEEITAGDFVMLINLYRHIKNNDIQNDFINPYGKNKEV